MAGRYMDPNVHAPALRKVVANILMDAGWVHGTFQVPAQQSLLDYFGGAGPLLKLTQARFPGEAEPMPFLALRREVITLIDPTIDQNMVEAPGGVGRTSPHQVRCLLPAGQLHGTLGVLINVRLSDYLRQQTGLLVLRDCTFVPPGEPLTSAKCRRMAVALLNLGRAYGISES